MTEDSAALTHAEARDIGDFGSLQIIKPIGAEPFDREAAQAPTPDMTNPGGRVLSHPNIVNIYLNASGPPADSQDFDEWSRAIVEGGFLDTLSLYGVGLGSFLGSYSLTIPTSTFQGNQVITDTLLQTSLHRAIANGSLPKGDWQTSYHFIFPDGVGHIWQGVGTCGSPKIGYCGIHLVSSEGVLYAVIGSPSCYGCHGEFRPRQTRMGAYSHELAEECTDPFGDAVWDRRTGEELGDVCVYWPDPSMPWTGPVNMVAYGPPEKDWWAQREWVNGQGCAISDYQPKPDPNPTPDPDPQPTLQDLYWQWLVDVGNWGKNASAAARVAEAQVVQGLTATVYPNVITPAVTAELASAPKPPRQPDLQALTWPWRPITE